MTINISIIITTYNAESYVLDTLQSIANQSFQQFEIIIVDDGSVDNTLAVIKSFTEFNPALKIHMHKLEHIGRAAALNYAIKQAQYDWVAIIDADDLWSKNKLAQQVLALKNYNIDFLATKSKIFFDVNQIDINETLPLKNDRPAPYKI